MSREGAEQIALALEWGPGMKTAGINLSVFKPQPHARVLPVGTPQNQGGLVSLSALLLFPSPLLSSPSCPPSLTRPPLSPCLGVLTEHSALWHVSPTPLFMGIFYFVYI